MASQKAALNLGVSVVIPAYNYACYLPKAIDSVLEQEYPYYEIIVVDDGSTDNTAELVAAYGDRVRYIYQKNAGLPTARNTGIKAAHFDFVGFLDADDEWLPSRLKDALTRFAELPEEFGIIACRSMLIDSQGGPVKRKALVSNGVFEVRCADIMMKTQFSPSSVIARRIVFETCGYFDPTLRSSEDRDMWIRITHRYRALVNGERLIRVRRHSNNMSKHADRMRQNTRRVLRQSFKNAYVPKTKFPFWMRVFAYNHFETAWMYWDEGRRGAALREILLSLAWCPFFVNPNRLNEPTLFRLRALARFTLSANSRKKTAG
ncbi:MAG: glycosyltransferase family 2 protein [Verrucomicrobia bacterium]|nr:glycosyltransferase family 2 protein [Verrucomicrobiota bacterium]